MSIDVSSQDDEDEDWDDIEEDSIATPCCSLIGRTLADTVESAVKADAKEFGFDFVVFRREARLDDFETIQCINFIRSHEKRGQALVELLAGIHSGGSRPWTEEQFMRPAMEGDEYLLFDWDEGDMDTGGGEVYTGSMAAKRAYLKSDSTEALQHENAVLRNAVVELSHLVPQELAAELFQSLGADGAVAIDQLQRLAIEVPSTSGNPASPLLMARARGMPALPDTAIVDAQYFESYSRFGIHREMISDKVRTEAYLRALEGNHRLLRGATVLDIGCGTGILSLFAARGGASRVIGVEGSQTMAECAARIAGVNGLLDQAGGPLTILAGRLEDIVQLPVDKVDVIVSEWMGYSLFFEAMLDTVLHARDRWLKPGGAVLPDVAKLFLAGGGSGSLGTGFWGNVYGFSMEPVAQQIWAASQSKAVVCEVPASEILTDTAAIQTFDLATMRQEEADFSTQFQLVGGSQAGLPCAALVVWFDVDFSGRYCSQQPVILSTSPFSTQTHWAQTVLPLREPVVLGPGGLLTGRISLARSKEHRSLDVSVEYQTPFTQGAGIESCALSYRVAMS